MRRDLYIFGSVLACAVMASVLPLSATQIVINNPGFEESVPFTATCGPAQGCNPTQEFAPGNIPGWSVSDPNNLGDPGGTWAPVPLITSNGVEMFIYPLEGSQVAYTNGGIISQELSQDAQPGMAYVLSVAVGLRAEFVPPYDASYTISLLAGTTVLGSWTDNTYGSNHLNPITNTPMSPLIRGGWQTIQFTSQNINLAGVPLVIQLTGNGQVDFDSVNLQMFHVVPEPGTYALMGSALLMLGVVLRRRKKTP